MRCRLKGCAAPCRCAEVVSLAAWLVRLLTACRAAAHSAVALRRATALEATVEAAALVAALLDACSAACGAAAVTARVRSHGRRAHACARCACADNCVVCAVTRGCVRRLLWNFLSILWHAAVFQDEAQPQRRGDASSVPRAQLLHCDARVP
ncbi:hypothetical protein ERJ75_000588900 [Trypanosoma vivax]|nr:hypothetical protein ERJ75_000588900 [Trypanosoma vivax]